MKQIIEILLKILDALLKPIEVVKDAVTTKTYRNKAILINAAKELGVLEWGNGSNPKVEKYLDHGARGDNKNSGLKDNTPWCAGFIAYVLETARGIIGSNPLENIGSTNSLMARSYEKWGKKVTNPLPGDIVTRYRSGINSGFGHVGFFLGWTSPSKSSYYCLGGNQNDSVNISTYTINKGSNSGHSMFRRSSKHVPITLEMENELWDLANRIINGEDVSENATVV